MAQQEQVTAECRETIKQAEHELLMIHLRPFWIIAIVFCAVIALLVIWEFGNGMAVFWTVVLLVYLSSLPSWERTPK